MQINISVLSLIHRHNIKHRNTRITTGYGNGWYNSQEVIVARAKRRDAQNSGNDTDKHTDLWGHTLIMVHFKSTPSKEPYMHVWESMSKWLLIWKNIVEHEKNVHGSKLFYLWHS